MKLKIKEGTTSKIVRLFIQDSTATNGDGLAGLTNASSGLTAYYIPEGDASAVAITLSAGTVGTYSSGGFKEIDATNMPGVYELGLPDAVIDNTSEGSTLVMLKGATNMVPCLLEIELDAINYRTGVVPTVTANTDMRGTDGANTTTPNTVTPPTAAAIADAVWDEARAGHTTAGTFGEFTGDAAMRGTDSANTTTPPTATAVRDAILDRVLAGNHDTAGTVGKVLQGVTVIAFGAGQIPLREGIEYTFTASDDAEAHDVTVTPTP